MIVVVLVVIAVYLQRRRPERLCQHFVPEYDRAVAEVGGRRQAKMRLEKRTYRVKRFHLCPIIPSDSARFTQLWDRVQAHFVDAPEGAVAEADQLLGDIMARRGYPMDDFEQRATDISVDHPIVTRIIGQAMKSRFGRREARPAPKI